MHNPLRPQVLPMRDGVSPSCVALPVGPWATVMDFLAERLPIVSRAQWHARMVAGEVVDEFGVPVSPERPYRHSMRVFYYRALEQELRVPFEAQILHQDAHLLVVDKPHFLPVVPTGRYLHETLLVRLKRQLGIEALSPLHRLDRDTAGVMLFSVQQATRGAYQALFRDRRITKHYEAVAPWRQGIVFPLTRSSRIEESQQFFRTQEVEGAPNAQTHIELLRVLADGAHALYRLEPVSGKRHQLRVHMAALGLPLVHDHFYPVVNDPPEGDYSEPLQLLARRIAFVDPLTGDERVFESRRVLACAQPGA